MGNKLGRRRQVVDERYTKPQGLYVHKDVDHKKLRKLILESKLAPCYPGDDDFGNDNEECPICFLYYPSLNRSRCCMKGICTECFLQMKNPNSTRPTQCPFCKTTNYAVEYRGVKTMEEKGLEQIEEQRVIEAKIRMRQQELQDEEERMQKRLEVSSSSTCIAPGEVECSSAAVESGSAAAQSFRSAVEVDGIVPSQFSVRHSPHYRANRDEEFDLDLEDIMVMEAIWLSIQENGRQKNPMYTDACSAGNHVVQGHYASQAMAPVTGSSSSPSGGLACAIAALAERQQTTGGSFVNTNENVSTCNMLPGSSSFYHRLDQDAENYHPTQSCGSMPLGCRMSSTRDDVQWVGDRRSDAAEAGTSYASSDTTDDSEDISAILPPPPPPPEEILGSESGPIVPEGFEEQMMLAMAVSLAEAQTVASGTGSSWQ